MPLVAVENVGELGIVLDEEDYNLPPEAWSGGENVRFIDGYVEKFPGETAVFGTPSVAPHWLLPWKVTTEYRWIYAGTADVYYYNGSTHQIITRYTTTPGDDDYTAGTRPVWTGGVLHGVPILNHDAGTDYPQQWDGALSPARLKDLANWPASTYARVIRPYKNFLIALDVTKSGTRYPYIVKWSHPADPGTVPTSWDIADATKLAGEQTIAQSGGFLQDCLPLGDTNILYKSDAIWGMQLSGSLDVFRFFEISGTVGALAPNCIAEFYRQHFVVGAADIFLFDGVRPRSIISRKMRKWFYGVLDPDYYEKTVVTVNYSSREVWVCFVESGGTSTYLNKALIWNWERNNWTVKDLDEISFMASGEVGTSAPDTFDGSSGTFDTDFGIFGSATGIAPAELKTLQSRAYATAAFLQADSGYTNRGTNYTSYVERTGLTIVGRDRGGNPKVDQGSVKFLRAVIPKISAQIGTVIRVYAGAQDYPEDSVRWEGPYDYIVGTSTHINFTVSGKYLAVKFEDTNNVPWKLSGYLLDIDVISRY